MKDVLFGCQGLDLSLAGRQILSGVSLSLNAGELLGLVGPNGAGKTSLFEVFCGRYKNDRGSVFLEGKDITGLSFHNRTRRGVGRTFQSPVVPMSLSVAETFRATRKAWKPYLSRHDAEWAARLAHLSVNWETPAAALGAFDRRKLILACLLMRRPKVLLMDEPASGLINAEIDELELIIRRLVDEYRIGVVLIEHRLELLAAVADRTVVLDLGEVIAEGTPEDVFLNPRVKAAYFVNENGNGIFGLKHLKDQFREHLPNWDAERLPKSLRDLVTRPGDHILRDLNLMVHSEAVAGENRMGLHKLTLRPLTSFDLLTKREQVVAEVLAQGKSHKETARILGVAPSTIRNQTQSIYAKLEVDNRVSLAAHLPR